MRIPPNPIQYPPHKENTVTDTSSEDYDTVEKDRFYLDSFCDERIMYCVIYLVNYLRYYMG